MAKFEVRGIGDVISAFESIASIPSSVMKEILNAQADVVTAAQQRAAPRNMGTLSESIKKKSPRITYDGGYIMVAPKAYTTATRAVEAGTAIVAAGAGVKPGMQRSPSSTSTAHPAAISPASSGCSEPTTIAKLQPPLPERKSFSTGSHRAGSNF